MYSVVVGCVVGLLCTVGFGFMQQGYQAQARVVFLNVGQGDSVYIQSPSGRTMLVDGGAGAHVLSELAAVMPAFSHHIDVVLGTHPDADHIGGLVDVLRSYTAGRVVYHHMVHDTPQVRVFEEEIVKEGVVWADPQRGDVYDLGAGMKVQILFPDRPLQGVETNDASVVARVLYGSSTVLLTGDAPRGVEKYLVQLDGALLQSDVLKAGHHGSKTSSAEAFLQTVAPRYGVYSRGCDNTYGHPNQGIVAIFNAFKVRTFDTCTHGRIEFVLTGSGVERVQ
jgi:competence protein ComEC